MASDPADQRLLPENTPSFHTPEIRSPDLRTPSVPSVELHTPEPVSSWSPFENTRSTRYESVNLHEAPSVGLGIHPAFRSPSTRGHVRTTSNLTTATESAISDRTSRYLGSETTLLDDHLHAPGTRCPTKRTIVQRRLSWIPVTIIVLAVYSTAVSGLFLAVAFWKPRYGKFIGVEGHLVPSTANLLSALFAKTVELAYVTVCVAFLGQVLSRRAITKGSQGISISDMSMRSWIMQPGCLIVHWESLRYSALTILGGITLTATLVAMLYTTAAEALVSPKLSWGPVEDVTLSGRVHTQFANPVYLEARCPTPVTVEMDPAYRNTTCLDMEHVGQAYHNYQAYLQAWNQVAKDRRRPYGTSLDKRPLPVGSLHDNTTITGSWIDETDTAELSTRYGRLVVNVTAAMPHRGIMDAAIDPLNDIPQPPDLSGEGNYLLAASVPSPAVNVLCAGMTADELAPLVYKEWPDIKHFDPVDWTLNPPDDVPRFPDWLNRTVVDDLFGFGEPYGQRPPIFGKLPLPYDTLLNTTGYYPANAIYLLGATPPHTDPPYVMCALKAKQTPHCSTHYTVAGEGADLFTKCNSPSDTLRYSHNNPDALDGVWAPDWKNIASQWATSLSLGTGITNGRGSNSRLLMQLVPGHHTSSLKNSTLPTTKRQEGTFSLSRHLPSISEALAVLASNTLTMSTRDAPFVPYWNYSTPSLSSPVLQSFTATVQSMGYASGAAQKWQAVFYIILVFAFVTSAICLAFMVFEVRGRQVTDFTEPQNLFALAMGSPASERLRGACGAGPEGGQLGERWVVGMEEGEEHYYIRSRKQNPDTEGVRRRWEGKGMEELGIEEDAEGKGGSGSGRSPAMEEYQRLSARGSWLSRWY